MVVQKLSISLSPELASVLRELARSRRDDVSRLVEILLRENPLVAARVDAARRPPATKRGRDPAKLLALGRAAARAWERRARRGEVRIRGRG